MLLPITPVFADRYRGCWVSFESPWKDGLCCRRFCGRQWQKVASVKTLKFTLLPIPPVVADRYRGCWASFESPCKYGLVAEGLMGDGGKKLQQSKL